MTTLLRVDNLSLRYAGGVQALDDVSLEIGPELVGLLGPNGAGKTTLLSVLARRLRPQGGSGTLLGIPLENPRARLDWLSKISFLPQEEASPSVLSGREVVETALALARPEWPRTKRRQAAEDALARVGLSNVAERRAIGYSGGMRRRLGLARALASEPLLLLVDEPTSGLDPEERVAFRDLLGNLADLSSVLVSTHIAADVELSCSRVVVFVAGTVIWDGIPSQLIARCSDHVFSCTVAENDLERMKKTARITSVMQRHEGYDVRYLAEQPINKASKPVAPSLEEAYIRLVQERTPEEAIDAS
jgi:ABC-type multidrug transport system ATPase subunit